jgi:cephalosporin hydroxylase
MLQELILIHKNHHGKASDKWIHNLLAYQKIFSEFRSKKINLLEIGIQNGGSLDVWAEYFYKANLLVGCDIDPLVKKLVYTQEKIKVVVGDVNSDEVFQNIKTLADQFDIIIDDGSHTSKDIVTSFFKYFPLLKEGGVYVVEDLHASYWSVFGGGLFSPISAISFFKKMVDVVNKEHWGVPRTMQWFFRLFSVNYNISFEENLLDSVYSVEFLNSMCVIRKTAPAQVRLNERCVSGEDFSVNQEAIEMHRRSCYVPTQSSNVWSNSPNLPEEELILCKRELEKGK